MSCHNAATSHFSGIDNMPGVMQRNAMAKTWILIDPNCDHCRTLLTDMLENGPVDSSKYYVYLLRGPDDKMMDLCEKSDFPHCFDCTKDDLPHMENYKKYPANERWWK